VAERLSEEVTRLLEEAKEQARGLGHGWLGTEHLVLAELYLNTGLAAQALDALDITFERFKSCVVRTLGPCDNDRAGDIEWTERVHVVLKYARDAARIAGKDQLGPEDILLGIARDNDGIASRLLLDLGANSNQTIEAVIKEMEKQRADQTSEELLAHGLRCIDQALTGMTAKPAYTPRTIGAGIRWFMELRKWFNATQS
jgi:ATP-dependent Clp protease ATP-binding subunit ClpC